ncbi:hypothetical protein B0H16DRAFT_1753176 [Mycena metata]|uniref:Uncharacterized protein n=1 Tax=Mycena metata TaxID=1033252 RepID=A0AAD7DE15_9AGAR|nr:hypothetical protein B0H16DRAFT_1753176 [Mycena metata]
MMFAGELTEPIPAYLRQESSNHSLSSEYTLTPTSKITSINAEFEGITEVQREHKEYQVPGPTEQGALAETAIVERSLSPIHRANRRLRDFIVYARDSFFKRASSRQSNYSRESPLEFEDASTTSCAVEAHEWTEGGDDESSVRFATARVPSTDGGSKGNTDAVRPSLDLPIIPATATIEPLAQTFAEALVDTYDKYPFILPFPSTSSGSLPPPIFTLTRRLLRPHTLPVTTFEPVGPHERVIVLVYHDMYDQAQYVVRSIPIRKLQLGTTLECFKQLTGVWKVVAFYFHPQGYVFVSCVNEETRTQTDILVEGYHCATHPTLAQTVDVLTFLAGLTLKGYFATGSRKVKQVKERVMHWTKKN